MQNPFKEERCPSENATVTISTTNFARACGAMELI